MSISDLRREYPGGPLIESEAGGDPLALFVRWFERARLGEPDPTAMSLATATPGGRPSVRTVLLKEFDARGFVFYTNFDSRKAGELEATGRASLLFFWRGDDRQVRIDGRVERVDAAESDAYFASRPLESRLSVYASHQSASIANRQALDDLFAAAAAKFPDGKVPRPDWWGGYRVVPDELEFWQGRPHRMHDRLRYTRDGAAWRRERLAP